MVTINGVAAVARILAMGIGNNQNFPTTTHVVPSVGTVFISM